LRGERDGVKLARGELGGRGAMSREGMVTAALAAGWLAQAAAWLVALRRAGRRAAARGAWPREALIRAAMLAVVVWGLAAPRAPWPGGLAVLAMVVFLAAQAMAIVARRQLDAAWGIGVAPHGGEAPVRSGLYALTRHPIYAGMLLAALAQYALLRNLPSLLLVGGTAVVSLIKGWRETKHLAGGGTAP
jgi:protein-S-isoprenylcysteine O-methyltransferase Ste14